MSTPRIILAQDASHAYVELLPELRVSLRTEADVDTFITRAARHGFVVAAESGRQDYVAPAGSRS